MTADSVVALLPLQRTLSVGPSLLKHQTGGTRHMGLQLEVGLPSWAAPTTLDNEDLEPRYGMIDKREGS